VSDTVEGAQNSNGKAPQSDVDTQAA
jgi:hypothetical protein